jgi:pimeloyl-ACP methyl ester carboxylesterase
VRCDPPIPLPVTLIWGEADSCLGTELMDGHERFAPNIQLHVVPDAGHFVHQESPDAVNAILRGALY